jgi:hypothetical protein
MRATLTRKVNTYRSQQSIGMYPFTIDLVLQVVRLDVSPKSLDNPCSTFFLDTQNVPYKEEEFSSCSQRRSDISYRALGALGTAQGIVVGEE